MDTTLAADATASVAESPAQAAERRAHERRHANVGVPVLELPPGTPLGRLLDVSLGGLRLETSRTLQKGTVYQLRIDAGALEPTLTKIEVRARTSWCQAADAAGLRQVGFMFVGLSELTWGKLQRFIDKLGR